MNDQTEEVLDLPIAEAVATEKKFSLESLERLTYEKAKQVHENFEVQVWKKRDDNILMRYEDDSIEQPSYHNWNHIEAARSAVDFIFKEENIRDDPFMIESDLQSWNKRNGLEDDEAITKEDLHACMKTMFNFHDTGNTLAEKDGSVVDKEGKPIQAEKYMGDRPQGEERSVKFFKHIIAGEKAKIDTLPVKERKKAQAQIKLIEELTMKTVFDFTKNKPPEGQPEEFWHLVQYIDQIGTIHFSENTNEANVVGLITEELTYGYVGKIPASTSGYFKFEEVRGGILAKGMEKQDYKKIQEMFAKKTQKPPSDHDKTLVLAMDQRLARLQPQTATA